MNNTITDMEKRIADLAYSEKISIPQAKDLERLYKAGYDIEPALKGRIDGLTRGKKMVQYVVDGNADGIAKLIEETKEEDALIEKTLLDAQKAGF
jgi:hypothetical protein